MKKYYHSLSRVSKRGSDLYTCYLLTHWLDTVIEEEYIQPGFVDLSYSSDRQFKGSAHGQACQLIPGRQKSIQAP